MTATSRSKLGFSALAGGATLFVGLAGWLIAVAPGNAVADLRAARLQMALSLGWHIVLACLGVGFPLLILIAEGRHILTGDPLARRLARRWSKILGVLFAIGAVSGTILSFELGMLWPGLMGRFGAVIGLPFALEAIAFFIESIFIGIYVYGWDRLSPRAHWWSGVPIVLSGIASAFFVVTANAWMNCPRGFQLVDGLPTAIDPWSAMFNPATPVQAVHLILAAFMVTGFLVASVHAFNLLRHRGEPGITRLGLTIALALAAAASPLQIVAGDWATRFVAQTQPVKLAAFEGLLKTQRGAPLHIGGIPVDGELRYSIAIPKALSLLVHGDPDAEVAGLDAVAVADRPPRLVPIIAFQAMVGAGFILVATSVWFVVGILRRVPQLGRGFLRTVIAAGPLSVVALEAGWVVTEVGRQPWMVQGVLRVADSVSAAPNLRYGCLGVVIVYGALTTATVYALLHLAGHDAEPRA